MYPWRVSRSCPAIFSARFLPFASSVLMASSKLAASSSAFLQSSGPAPVVSRSRCISLTVYSMLLRTPLPRHSHLVRGLCEHSEHETMRDMQKYHVHTFLSQQPAEASSQREGASISPVADKVGRPAQIPGSLMRLLGNQF